MPEEINFIPVDRYWFLTWTTYGTWLPGDERGFVGRVADDSGQMNDHNQIGTQPAVPNRNLLRVAKQQLKSHPILLNLPQSEALFEQFQETARIRGWLLIAVGVMKTHVHVVVGVIGDPDPENVLRDFKAYGSGCLNRKWKRPLSDTWLTTSGSKRKLEEDRDVETVVHYIRNQPNPLLIWARSEGRIV